MPRKVRSLLVVGLAILLGAGGVIGFHLLQPAQGQTTSAYSGGQSTSAASSRPVPAEVAQAVQSLPADPNGYVSLQSPVRDSAASAFPPGTTTGVVQNTWAETVANQGLVQVSITRPGKSSETYAAMMVFEDGKWKVLATVPVEK